MNQEIFDYLMNFWDHSLGSTVKDINGEALFISNIDQEDSSQVQLCDIQRWHFIQDLTWFPDLEEAVNVVCKKIGITVHLDSIQYQKNIKPTPKSFEELYESITDIRAYILSNN